MEEEAVRWNIKVSKETDLTLRTFLGARGMKKGDLSKFIEEAVRWRVFQRTVEDIKARNADADPDEIQRIVDEAVGEVRAERRAQPKVKPDARGARYQHPGFRPPGSTGAPGRDLSRLAGGTFYAPDLRRAARRADGHVAQARDRRAHQAL